MDLKEFALNIFDMGGVSFGDFTTKDNVYTPVYFDFRHLISHPTLLHKIARKLWSLVTDVETSRICGVPYMAIPLSTIISIDADIPMVIRRKEIKPYGMRKLIEGEFTKGENVLIIEDVVVSGSSIMETTRDLEKVGLRVTHALVILDREQGAVENLKKEGITMKSLYTLSSFLQYLHDAGKITAKNVEDSKQYIKNNPIKLPSTVLRPSVNRLHLRFSERARLTSNKMAEKLFQLMESKRTTLCLAADLTSASDICALAEVAGPSIAVLKIHADIITDFNDGFIQSLQNTANKYNFLLMEDRKFGDIGNTVALQYSKGIHKISEWADFITVHSVAGPSTLDALRQIVEEINSDCGIFLVTQMSSKGALTTGGYIKLSQTIADSFTNIVVGHVCQSDIFHEPGFIQLTPGVRISSASDNLGQQYNSPETVVNAGADLVVVGRGITEASDKVSAVNQYRELLWSAYEKRVRK